MTNKPRARTSTLDQRLLAGLTIVLAVVVFAFTWLSIRGSRSDSLELLVRQGTAFTEALALAAENALASESSFDYLVHLRYNEAVRGLLSLKADSYDNHDLVQLTMAHDFHAIYVFDSSAGPIAGGAARGPEVGPPDFVVDEVSELLSNPERSYTLLLDDGEFPDQPVHYHLQITNDLKHVVIVVADARYYVDALRQTQIGFMAQNMAREQGVEYIVYQSTDGIVFASRKTGSILSIESDPFLSAALESDTITHRLHTFQDLQVLELVRPFSSEDYPFGLLRVGLSLRDYYSVSGGFDRQMILLGVVLFVLLTVALLYINSRQKRREITRRFTRMKTVTDRIFDEMQTGVAAVDGRGRFSLVNDAFERILGMTDAVGRSWDATMPPAIPRVAEIIAADEGSHETEVEVAVDGKMRVLLVATSLLETPDDRPRGLVAVAYDITRLQKFERESARRERLSEMGNLAAGVAHEIRNPLNTISIAAQRLEAEFSPTSDDEEYQNITSRIRAETARLNTIITRFLALARDEKRRFQKLSLDVVIDESVALIRDEAEGLDIKLTAEIHPDLVVEADPDSIKQIISNLYNNAREALNGAPGVMSLTARRENSSVVITFEDSGPGIPENIRNEVFTPYFTTKDGGTGLGLPTIHKLVSEMGGEVEIRESTLGGAAFVITLTG